MSMTLNTKPAPHNDPQTPNSDDRVRLHITPFTPELLKTYLPPSLLPLATNISFHTLQTFPEKGFGYVEMPKTEAEKLRKKLNGAILKGSKVKIEEAREEKENKKDKKRKLKEEEQPAAVAEDDEPKKKSKKVKRGDGVLLGYELPEGRVVKRGRTEPESEKQKAKRDKKEKKSEASTKDDKKRKREPSKYTNEPEVLFRTKLPPNVPAPVERSKKKSKSRELVVHEFERTQKHATFLKTTKVSGDAKMAHEYLEGKGWADEDGNVIEQESESKQRRREGKAAQEEQRRKEAEEAKRKAQAEEDALAAQKAVGNKSSVEVESDHSESSVGDTSSSSEDESEGDSDSSEHDSVSEQALDDLESLKSTSKPSAEPTSEATEVHPLEALFKRPDPTVGTPKPAPINTSFKFFDAIGEDQEDMEDAHAVPEDFPQTPFGQDRQRRIRSAAPTPDTAAVDRQFFFAEERSEEDEDEEMQDGKDSESETDVGAEAPPASKGAIEGNGTAKDGEDESEFSKWFWEHRGENNRAWKARKREAMKLKRKRENKRLSRRVV
ncbi:hypothetical protein EJ06DRAFT_532044 [Trichodelitschia bisporula]|uniref:RRM domain-containing protein n=1 Tax=Trichodelitschia bisporula TaxID=703511 RepID=A0A6G1HR26_9PEZI|nr:hypothetical protein EJ06DRAFT_532044 [Trichodelitschia bisporula]